MGLKIEIDKDIAKALYERLLKPSTDSDKNLVYTISITLAREIREALYEHVGK